LISKQIPGTGTVGLSVKEQGCQSVREKSGKSQGKVREKQINFSRSGKSLGMLLKVKENLSSCQSQQTVREFKADACATEAETKKQKWICWSSTCKMPYMCVQNPIKIVS